MKLFSQKNLTRFLVILVFILSLLAGYYQSSLSTEKRKYEKLEAEYNQTRDELKMEQTQVFIDDSL